MINSGGPGSAGSRGFPDARQQEPGSWNRLVLRVDDLESVVGKMKEAGLRIETGPAGKQIQVEDPYGNSNRAAELATLITNG
jgi:glyoxylase I family protein